MELWKYAFNLNIFYYCVCVGASVYLQWCVCGGHSTVFGGWFSSNSSCQVHMVNTFTLWSHQLFFGLFFFSSKKVLTFTYLIFFFGMCMCVDWCVPQCVYVYKSEDTLVRVGSLCTLVGFWRLNLGDRAWQEPLFTDPSHQPWTQLLNRIETQS